LGLRTADDAKRWLKVSAVVGLLAPTLMPAEPEKISLWMPLITASLAKLNEKARLGGATSRSAKVSNGASDLDKTCPPQAREESPSRANRGAPFLGDHA
jgi:hypothetical protein